MLYRSNWEKNWYTDQLVITWALLANRICSVPASSNLWSGFGLKFDPALDDSKTCFHGFGYENCNKGLAPNHRVRRTGCKWWHFLYYENFQSHLNKFYQLTNNSVTIDPQILDYINV